MICECPSDLDAPYCRFCQDMADRDSDAVEIRLQLYPEVVVYGPSVGIPIEEEEALECPDCGESVGGHDDSRCDP